MEIRQIIADMRSSLEHITVDDELIEVITPGLTTLRQSYRSDRSLFTRRDIDFLKSLAEFVELIEELPNVTLQDYEDTMRRLTDVKHALACFPVARRIAKHIRELKERLPALQERDEAHQHFLQFLQDTRIADLNEDPPYCRRNHPMVIRHGPHGYFWGCSHYRQNPPCTETSQLTRKERDLFTL